MPSDDGADHWPPPESEPRARPIDVTGAAPGWRWDIPLPDSTPTGNLQIFEPAERREPEPAEERPTTLTRSFGHHRGKARVALAVLLPLIVVLLGLGFIGLAIGAGEDGGGGDSSETADSNPSATAPPRPATTIAIPGDPLEAAKSLVADFVAMIAAGDHAGASALTGGTISESGIARRYDIDGIDQRVLDAQLSGRGTYTLRVLMISKPDADGPPRFRCERWAVEPSANQALPDADTVEIDPAGVEPAPGSTVPATTEALFAAAEKMCLAASVG